MVGKLFMITCAVVLCAGAAVADPQGPPDGPGGSRDQNRGEACVDGTPVSPEDVAILTGTVESTDMGEGLKVPTFTLALEEATASVTIVTGPYYLLLETGFSVAAGDLVEVQAFPCAKYDDTYVAITVTKNPGTEEAEVLQLRDEDGTPLWGQHRPGDGNPLGERDLAAFEGTVTSADLSPEEGHATFVLDEEVTFIVPRYALIENEIAINEGDAITVVAFPSGRLEDAFIAVEVTLANGETIVLIDPEDRPPRPRFRRGDANGSGEVDLADAVGILQGLFGGGPRFACQDACDANDDGAVDISDGIFVLRYMFAHGKPMPAPYPDRGNDGTRDRLICQ